MSFSEIPIDRLSGAALDSLIEEFVTRDGTDYGVQESTLANKKIAVRRQLDRGEVVIVYDHETQTANLIQRGDLDDARGQ